MAAVEENGAEAQAGLVVTRRGACGDIVLQSPQTRNALSASMIGPLLAAYPGFARDPIIYAAVVRSSVAGVFSDGSDVAGWTTFSKANLPEARQQLADMLQLCWLHECFSKPTVSLMDGLVGGSGIGISLYGTHRVAGAGYRFVVPDVRHGRVPSCGVLYAFSRLPDSIGLYLALTGRPVGRSDALPLGLVTHCIDGQHFADISSGLADADPVDPLLDNLHVEPPASPLLADGSRIRRYFEGGDVGAIVARLTSAPVEDRSWAEGVLADLTAGSPIALRVTSRAIREARGLDLREVLVQDYRVGYRMIASADFRGSGAREPSQFRPEAIADISDGVVDAFFTPTGADELILKTRAEMQAARM